MSIIFLFETSFILRFQVAKKAYESVMVIRPRRPTTEEFFEFEKEAMRLSSQLNDYKWPEDTEVRAETRRPELNIN